MLNHIWSDPHEGDIIMIPRPRGYVYGVGGVRLLFVPENTMTWGLWGETLREVRKFGEVWEFVGLEFDLTDGETSMGSGQLYEVW